MKHATQLLILILALSVPVSASSELTTAADASPVSGAPAHPRDADYPYSLTEGGTLVYAATREGLELARSGLRKYEEADLVLPELTLWMHDSRLGCSVEPGATNRSGVFVISTKRLVIHNCGPEFTLLHELGHAYVHLNVNADQRARFLDTRIANGWRGHDWRLNGTEHAANVLAWKLLDGAVVPDRTLPNDETSLQLGYEILTESE